MIRGLGAKMRLNNWHVMLNPIVMSCHGQFTSRLFALQSLEFPDVPLGSHSRNALHGRALDSLGEAGMMASH